MQTPTQTVIIDKNSRVLGSNPGKISGVRTTLPLVQRFYSHPRFKFSVKNATGVDKKNKTNIKATGSNYEIEK